MSIKDTDLSRLNQSDIAKLLGTSMTTILKWETKDFDDVGCGPFPKAEKSGVNKFYSWKTVLTWWAKWQALSKYKDLMPTPEEGEVDFNLWKAREKKANALMAENELETAQKLLLPAEEVIAKWEDLSNKIKAKFLTVPSRLAALIHDGQTAAEREAVLDTEVREILRELASIK